MGLPVASSLVLVACIGAAVKLSGSGHDAGRRLTRLLDPDGGRRLVAARVRWTGCAIGLVGLCWLARTVGVLVAVAIGSAGLFSAMRLLPSGAETGRRRTATADPIEVPAALDVLAACLCAGAPLDRALDSVASAFGGGVRDTLGPVASLTSWGAPIETAWAGLFDEPLWAPVARAVVRAAYSGATLADVFSQQAAECRRGLRASAAEGAQRAGVRAVLPLGLCFLPAFVLAGIVPVVAGFAETLR